MKFIGANFEAQKDSNNEFRSNVFEFYTNYNFYKINKQKAIGQSEINHYEQQFNSKQNSLQYSNQQQNEEEFTHIIDYNTKQNSKKLSSYRNVN